MIRQLTEPDDASQRHCTQPLCLEPGTQSCSPFPVFPHLVGCLATRKRGTSCGAPYHSYHAICLKRCDGHHHQHHQSRAQDCGWLVRIGMHLILEQAFLGEAARRHHCLWWLSTARWAQHEELQGHRGSEFTSSFIPSCWKARGLHCLQYLCPHLRLLVLSFAPNDDYPLECWEVSCLSTLNTDVTVREIPAGHFLSQI